MTCFVMVSSNDLLGENTGDVNVFPHVKRSREKISKRNASLGKNDARRRQTERKEESDHASDQ